MQSKCHAFKWIPLRETINKTTVSVRYRLASNYLDNRFEYHKDLQAVPACLSGGICAGCHIRSSLLLIASGLVRLSLLTLKHVLGHSSGDEGISQLLQMHK